MSKRKSDKTIDILYLTDNGLETVGGEQESIKVLLNGLKEKFNLAVIQPGKFKKSIHEVVVYSVSNKNRIKHLITNPFNFINYIYKVRKIINQSNPKVIHTQAQVSFFIVASLKKTRLISNDFIFIHTERGLGIRYSSFFRQLFKILMSELNVLVTTTKYNLKGWKQILHKQRHIEYLIIENTAGEIFEVFDENKKKTNRKLVIGFAGRYSEQKDWPLAVEIIEKLKKEIGDDLKVIMAIGCLDEKAYKDTKLLFRKMSNMLGDNFVGKINIDLKEMNKFYYDIDVFIMTSKPNSESFGRTLVEAMSRKNAVLSTNAGGPVEIVNNERNILNDSGDFVDRVMQLYRNTELLNKEKNNNYNSVKQNYSLLNNINKHISLYTNYLE